jgi:hypothetical protein
MSSKEAAFHDDGAAPLEMGSLSAADVNEIYDLYMLARSSLSEGFLARRSRDDIREIFAEGKDAIATGARFNGRLIAYSICHRVAENPYPLNPVLSSIDATKSRVYHGDGTVVEPRFRGRMIAQRILRVRWQQIWHRQIDHLFGLIAVDNIVSIGNVLHGGLLLAGLARDETALNYIAYAGRYCERLRTDGTRINVDLTDHGYQRRLFAEGKVVCEINSATPQRSLPSAIRRRRQIAFVPWKPQYDT